MASTKLVAAAKEVASVSDDDVKERMLNAAKALADATRKLVNAAGAAAAAPNDIDAHKALQDACQRCSGI
jgi:hypothetical protein